jgi:hypothetical protein
MCTREFYADFKFAEKIWKKFTQKKLYVDSAENSCQTVIEVDIPVS